ncbi:MAG: nucleoside kinase [Eubacteriales bacterium]|nr:nucleoside kinase [Eubacteriales bacterium]
MKKNASFGIDETGKIDSKVYLRTAVLVLMKAVNDLYGKEVMVNVEFKYGGAYYIKLGGIEATADVIKVISGKMRESVDAALPITRKKVSTKEAIETALSKNDFREAELLSYRISNETEIYCIGDYSTMFIGELFDSADKIRDFKLIRSEKGLLITGESLRFVEENDIKALSRKLFELQNVTEKWADYIGIDSVPDLNRAIADGTINDVVLMQEAFYEKKMGDAAHEIVYNKKKFVLLAGPSSSGKTTTSYRLAIQLRALGREPLIISADDYFFGIDKRPLLPDGTPDLESIRAVDTELFNSDMIKLLNGEEIELPTFNFKKSQREYHGKKISLGERTVLIIEGIHCLNPEFSVKIPDESKFFVYISALTPLCIDDHNPMATSDCRLLRRIIRDNRTRGYSAEDTLSKWSDVRKGETENIFPYQDNADYIFNSALVYELAVLKLFAAPLLFGIGEASPQYGEARRLLRCLELVLPMSTEIIPKTSVIREFIGGSCIDVT